MTWKNEILLVYDLISFKLIKTIKYSGEGWGLTTDGKHLLMSNGSAIIAVRDPRTFKVIRKIKIVDGDRVIEGLNELEFIDGEVWANIFMEDLIIRFNPENGKVKGWIDVSVLRAYLPRNAQVDMINGIAYDQGTGRVYVTGKLWPKLFEIRLVR